MNTKLILIASVVVIAVSASSITQAQSKTPDELPRYELGVDFTSLTLYESQTHPGVGGRFTFNLNRHVGLEAAGYFSPGNCKTCTGVVTGKITEGLFGVKAGQRFRKFGIFGKVRPGFLSFSQGTADLIPAASGDFVNLVTHRRTDFATDVGGVLEIYPQKRWFLRLDSGVTFDHLGARTVRSVRQDPVSGALVPFTFTTTPFTRRTFQFIAGVGFRF